MSGKGDIGVVVIGRNEGARLLRCLQSVLGHAACVVYVDSGSTDGSVAAAQAMGVLVVGLDIDQPFTAARARNAGWRALREALPDVRYIQFVDGDCEVQAQWWHAALAVLDERTDVAVVCGRRRERFPEASIYNRLCDREWDTPIGEARACGGDAMMRSAPLFAAGGYRDDLIAGEEPELCLRLRAAEWTIMRIDVEMTLHDAALLRFDQWWRRTQRSGYAFAEGAFLHGGPPERHWVAETRRAILWGLLIPLLIAFAWLISHQLTALALFLVYPLQLLRLALRPDRSVAARAVSSVFILLGRFPEALGVLTFYWRQWRAVRPTLIEYK